MAQIPRTLSPTAPTNVTSGRLPGGPRSVATADAAPVESLNQQEAILFNDALLYQEERDNGERRQRAPQQDIIVDHAGSTQAFAAIFEDGNAAGAREFTQRSSGKGVSNVMARAINTYEANVRVIHGTADPRGTNLSLTL